MNKMITVECKIPINEYEFFEKIAKSYNESISELLSEILMDWLDDFIESQNPSLWERINKERDAFHKEGGIDFEEYRTKRKLLNAKDHV
ncbi:MAG: hypothetical protein ACE5J9_02900 [Methanosarcinales archaeon]